MLRMKALFEWDGLNGMSAMIQCGMNAMAMEFFGSTHEPLREKFQRDFSNFPNGINQRS